MTLFWKQVRRSLVFSVTIVLLATLLAACSGQGSAPSPTTVVRTPAPSPTPALALYTGNGFTFSYPKDWTKTVSSGQIVFQDALGNNAFTVVVVDNAGGVVKPSAVLDATLTSGVKAAHMTDTSPAPLPASVSMDGETWVQGGTRGTVSQNGASSGFELVALVTNHPPHSSKTKVFELLYGGLLEGSTLTDESLFQAMLASFKFTS